MWQLTNWMQISSDVLWHAIIIMACVIVIQTFLLLTCAMFKCSGLIRTSLKMFVTYLMIPGGVAVVVFYYHEPLKGFLPTPIRLSEDGPIDPKQVPRDTPHFRAPNNPLPGAEEKDEEGGWLMKALQWADKLVPPPAPRDENGCTQEVERYVNKQGDIEYITKIKCPS